MKFLKDLEASTGKKPKALQNMPVLSFESWDYLEAFDSISMSRQAVDIPLSISDIKSYFDASGLFEDFLEFLHIMQVADGAFIKGTNK